MPSEFHVSPQTHGDGLQCHGMFIRHSERPMRDEKHRRGVRQGE